MIMINDEYKVDNDDICYTLYERKVTKEGKENWKVISYHKTIQSALKKYRDLNIKKLTRSSEVIQINDLIGKLITEDNRVLEELGKCSTNQN